MSVRECRAIFWTCIKWSLAQHVHIFCLPFILMKAQITRKRIKLSTALHELFSDTYWTHTPIDALFQFKTNEDRCIFRNEKCKVTFGVKCIL